MFAYIFGVTFYNIRTQQLTFYSMHNMKIITIVLSLLFSFGVQSSIFYPEVTCANKLNSASCGLKNNTSHVLSCEFLVVGETVKGQLVSNIKNSIVLPFDNAEMEITSDVASGDHLKFANGEANCHKL